MSDVVRWGFLGEVAEHILGQPRWQVRRHVAMVVGLVQGLQRYTETRRRASVSGILVGRSKLGA